MQKAGYSSRENIIGSRAVLYAECCAVPRADVRAVHCAVVRAELRADSVQNSVQPQRGDLFIECAMLIIPVAPAERPVHPAYRSLRWSYRYRWLAVGYKQVAPMELKRRAEIYADTRAVVLAEKWHRCRNICMNSAEPRAENDADKFAVICAEHRAVSRAEWFAEKIAPLQM